MTTSPHAASQPDYHNNPDAEFDLLVQESPRHSGSHAWSPHDDQVEWPTPTANPDELSVDWRATPEDSLEDDHTGAHAAPTTEYFSAGIPGRGVIAVTTVAVAAVVALDLVLVGRMSFFFDLSFVVVCLVGAMSVRRQDLFTAGVLPPLAFAGAVAALTVFFPEAILATGGLTKIFLTGLAAHAVGLVSGYGVALLTVAARMIARRQA